MTTTIERPPMSLAVKQLLVDHCGPATLRALACQIEESTPIRLACQQLDDAGVDALAEMLAAGRTPTIGWWRRHAH